MKKVYIKPQIRKRNVCIKNYIICASGTEDNTTWGRQLTKDRNTNDIWGSSDSDTESIW